MSAQFATYADLPEAAQQALKPIRDLIENVDGMDLTRWSGEGENMTGTDEGTVDADEAVVGFNKLIELLRK